MIRRGGWGCCCCCCCRFSTLLDIGDADSGGRDGRGSVFQYAGKMDCGGVLVDATGNDCGVQATISTAPVRSIPLETSSRGPFIVVGASRVNRSSISYLLYFEWRSVIVCVSPFSFYGWIYSTLSLDCIQCVCILL
jgi:hypothetical protein